MKVILKQLVVPGKAQTAQHHSGYLLLEEQLSDSPIARAVHFLGKAFPRSLPELLVRHTNTIQGSFYARP